MSCEDCDDCKCGGINFEDEYYIVNGLNGIPSITKGKFTYCKNKYYVRFNESKEQLLIFEDEQITCALDEGDDYGRRIFKLSEIDKAQAFMKFSCKEQIKNYEKENEKHTTLINNNKTIINQLVNQL